MATINIKAETLLKYVEEFDYDNKEMFSKLIKIDRKNGFNEILIAFLGYCEVDGKQCTAFCYFKKRGDEVFASLFLDSILYQTHKIENDSIFSFPS